MKFTKEQQDYLKHCGEHFEVLTGGRGYSKTKEVIEDLQQELDKYKNIINETKKLVNIAFEPDSQYIDYDAGVELLKQTFIDILYNDIGIDGEELKGSDR